MQESTGRHWRMVVWRSRTDWAQSKPRFLSNLILINVKFTSLNTHVDCLVKPVLWNENNPSKAIQKHQLVNFTSPAILTSNPVFPEKWPQEAQRCFWKEWGFNYFRIFRERVLLKHTFCMGRVTKVRNVQHHNDHPEPTDQDCHEVLSAVAHQVDNDMRCDTR